MDGHQPAMPSPFITAVFFAVWVVTLILSVMAMKLRQMLE